MLGGCSRLTLPRASEPAFVEILHDKRLGKQIIIFLRSANDIKQVLNIVNFITPRAKDNFVILRGLVGSAMKLNLWQNSTNQ